MKNVWKLAVALCALTACNKQEKPHDNAKTESVVVETVKEVVKEDESVDTDKLSETLGHLIVRHLDNPGFKFNVDKIMSGMRDEKEGKAAPMNEEEYEQTIATIQETLFMQLSQKNLAAAQEFLEKNAGAEGIVATSPKLQYKVLQEGEGDAVTADCVPLVHYTGKLLDGTTFSSSRETNNPIALPIKQTIPGFSEGLVGMKKGEKRTLYIHPELAYGVSGHLPPNSLLIFDVEIVEVDTTKPEAPAIEASTKTEETSLDEVTETADK
jgi:peptidylprolyl isomerase